VRRYLVTLGAIAATAAGLYVWRIGDNGGGRSGPAAAPQSGRPDGSADRAAGNAAADSAGSAGPDVPVHPLQRSLLAMGAAERSALFRRTIRERGLACADIGDIVALVDELPAWRVDCAGIDAYIVAADDNGRLIIETQIYHEGSVLPPLQPSEDGSGVVRPRLPNPVDPNPFDRIR